MNNIIIRETSSEIRAIARNALTGNWGKVFLGVLLYQVLLFTIPEILTVLIPGATTNYFNDVLNMMIPFSYVSDLYSFFLTGAFTLGVSYFFIAFFRRKDINPGHVFNGFENYIKSLGLFLVVSIFVFLWTLLFIVPGIIALLRYSQAFYILAEHPEKGIMECINDSKRMMTGNKGKLFILGLSFIGWAILASFASSAFAVFYPDLSYSLFNVLINLVLSIPTVFLMTYMSTAEVVFYDLVSGNLVAKPAFSEEDYHFTPRYVDQEDNKDQE